MVSKISTLWLPSFYGRLAFNSIGIIDRRGAAIVQYTNNFTNTILEIVSPLQFASAEVLMPIAPWSSSARNFPCPLGTRVVGGNPAATKCEVCPAGTFTSNLGSLLCSQCSVGYYQSSAGQSRCWECRAGTFAGDAGMAECVLCPAGTSSSRRAASCDSCPEGLTSSEGSDSCNIAVRNNVDGCRRLTGADRSKQGWDHRNLNVAGRTCTDPSRSVGCVLLP